MGSLELLLVFALGVTFLIHPGPGSSATAPLNPGTSPTGISGILYGVAFSITALSGFKVGRTFGRGDTQAKGVSLQGHHALGCHGWGVLHLHVLCECDRMGNIKHRCVRDQCEPVLCSCAQALGTSVVSDLRRLLNGALAIGIAATNAGSRVAYTMARGGALPAPLTRVDPVHRTPSTAIHVQTILSLGLMAIVGIWLGGGNRLRLPRHSNYGRPHRHVWHCQHRARRLLPPLRPKEFNIWRHGVIPILGTLLLLPVLWVTFWPIPAFPFNIVPYIFIAWMVIGFVAMKWIDNRRPQALRESAALLATAEE